VHTSTSEVYGTARSVPITEDHPLVGQSPYSASKIAADQMAIAFHRSFALPVTVLRPFNTYGPRQSARAVIPTIVTQALSGKRAIKLGALHPTRDLSFIDDTVAGFAAALRSESGAGEVVNLGTGYEIAIGELVPLIGEITGAELVVESDAERLRPQGSEVERLCADNSKAKRLFGWQPQLTGRDGLRRGLEKTVAWFRDSGNLARIDPNAYHV
jgi:dTDP-glucose 4,6-dehydratase